MKKFIVGLCIAFFPVFVSAQESISLFDEAPAQPAPPFPNVEPSQQPVSENAVATPLKTAPVPGQPRLGRNAAPLTSLVVEPVSGLSFGVDLSDTPVVPQNPQKVYQEPETPDNEVIRREGSLSFAEKEGKVTRPIAGERINVSDLQRHDVSKYKVAGIGLGDDTETVYDVLTDLGYTLEKVEKAIPRYRTTHYNDVCRKDKKLTVLSDIRACILDYAESDEMHYVSRETYARPESRERVQVSYSTPETGNVAYMVVYENRGDTSLNSTRINLAKKFKRRDDFWNMIFKMYGLPDDSDNRVWGDLNTRYLKAFMHGSAYHAYVLMEDKLIQDKDYDAAKSDFETLRAPTPFTLAGSVPEEDDE